MAPFHGSGDPERRARLSDRACPRILDKVRAGTPDRSTATVTGSIIMGMVLVWWLVTRLTYGCPFMDCSKFSCSWQTWNNGLPRRCSMTNPLRRSPCSHCRDHASFDMDLLRICVYCDEYGCHYYRFMYYTGVLRLHSNLSTFRRPLRCDQCTEIVSS